jgi:hypothetical protein
MKKKPYRTIMWVIGSKVDPTVIALGMYFLTRTQAERERKDLFCPKNWESIRMVEETK